MQMHEVLFSERYQSATMISSPAPLLLLLLVVASPALCAPSPDDQPDRGGLKRKRDDDIELPFRPDIDRLSLRARPNLNPASTAPFPVVKVEIISSQLPATTRAGFPLFVDQVRQLKQAGVLDDLRCFSKAAAAIYPNLAAKAQIGPRASSSGRRLFEDEVSATMNDFCSDVLAAFGDLISYHYVEKFKVDTGAVEKLPIQTSSTLDAAELCRPFQQGRVEARDIILAILEANAGQTARKRHLAKLADASQELFSMDDSATPSRDRDTLQLIELLAKELPLETDADFNETLLKLEELREAAQAIPNNHWADRLFALRDLMDRYGKSKHWRIHRYLLRLFQQYENLGGLREDSRLEPNPNLQASRSRKSTERTDRVESSAVAQQRTQQVDNTVDTQSTIDSVKFIEDYAQQCELKMIEAQVFALHSLEKVFNQMIDQIPAESRHQLQEIILLAPPPHAPGQERQPSREAVILAVKNYMAIHQLQMSESLFASSSLADGLLRNAKEVKRVQGSLSCISESVIEAQTAGNFSEVFEERTRVWLEISRMLEILDNLRPEDFGIPRSMTASSSTPVRPTIKPDKGRRHQ